MKKTYQIKINQGKESKTFEVVPGSTKGQALTIKAVEGARYQLVDKETTYGPENIRTSRIGKDLNISFEGSNQTDVVIEDYYKATPEGFNGLIGEAETGKFYEYIPENASGLASVPMLSHSSQVVGMALGGAEVASSGAAVGVLAAGLFSPWLLGAGAVGVAAAAGGGGGGNSGATGTTTTTTTTTPVVKSAELLTTDDTGPKDLVTNDKTPRISGVTTANADVSVEVNGKTYTKKADANGAFEIQIPDTDALPDAIYTPKVTASLNGVKSAVFDGTPFTVDTSEANNVPTKPDPNASNNKIEITAITDDTGLGVVNHSTRSDFYTNDKKLVFKGTLDKFTDNGDWIKLELKDVDAKVVDTAYVKPTASGAAWAWSWDRTNSNELADGKYTLNATVVDGADNVVGGAAAKVSDAQVIWIDTDKDNNFNTAGVKEVDSNKSSNIQILAMSNDSGFSDKDFVTSDKTHVYKGSIGGVFTANGGMVELILKDSSGKVLASDYVTPEATGSWMWDQNKNTLSDGNYILTASLVDKAGNPISSDVQSIVVDNSKNNNGNQIDPNADLQIASISLTIDTAGDNKVNNDYVTWDGANKNSIIGDEDDKINFGGKFDKSISNNGDLVKVEIISVASGEGKFTGYATAANDSWSYECPNSLVDGKYLVRVSLIDLAGNLIDLKDQSFQIDTKSANDINVNVANQNEKLKTIDNFLMNEYGTFSFTDKSNSSYVTKKGEYFGGKLNLGIDGVKTYKSGEFDLSFWDQAGNITEIVNTGETWQFTSKYLAEESYLEGGEKSFFKQDYSGVKPTGSIGTLDVSKNFDMATLYDGISAIVDKAAINHVKLSASANVNLELSMGDVLALGVTNSFDLGSTYPQHKEKLQMRIDGQTGDALNLDGLVGGSNIVWDIEINQLGLDGETYKVYKNDTMGVALIIDKDIVITMV